MDNQHRRISGYRELSESEIDLMNQAKSLEEQAGDLVRRLEAQGVDKRWLNIGRTDLQKGFMAVVRSITLPDSNLDPKGDK